MEYDPVESLTGVCWREGGGCSSQRVTGSTVWEGFRVSGFGIRVSGFGFRVSGFGFKVGGARPGARCPEKFYLSSLQARSSVPRSALRVEGLGRIVGEITMA